MAEEKIIHGCIDEQKSAQRYLCETYSPKMYYVCLRYAKHASEAQDISQDGFIKVFDNIMSFKFNSSFEGWIRRIIINTALNYCRKSSFKQEKLGIEDYQDKVVQSKAVSNLGEKELLALIQKLPEGYRMGYNLFVIEVFIHKEIGEMLDITESTSRSQLAKSRKWMQNELEKLKITSHV